MTTLPIACVIPALNAAPTLAGVISGLRSAFAGSKTFVVVIDDGSRDDTYQVAQDDADAVVRFPRNKGKGWRSGRAFPARSRSTPAPWSR